VQELMPHLKVFFRKSLSKVTFERKLSDVSGLRIRVDNPASHSYSSADHSQQSCFDREATSQCELFCVVLNYLLAEGQKGLMSVEACDYRN